MGKGSVVKIKDEIQPEQVSSSNSKRKRSLPKRFKDDELSTSSDDSGFLPHSTERNKGNSNTDRRIKNVACYYCDRKVVMEPVLQSHLLSRHFRADCERAITQILTSLMEGVHFVQEEAGTGQDNRSTGACFFIFPESIGLRTVSHSQETN